MTFTEYLQAKKFTAVTVAAYIKYIERFLTWLVDEEYPTDQPTIVPVIYASFAEAVVRYCW